LRGRLYQLAPAFDLGQESSTSLVENYLAHPNRWFRQQALRILADRRDASVIPLLNERIGSRTGQDALEAFWALHVSGGLDEERVRACLRHENPDVRRWCAHLLGDYPARTPRLLDALVARARDERDVEVRCQLAATAARFPASVGVPLAFALLNRVEDAHDVALPKILWWSLEVHAGATDLIANHLRDPAVWYSPFQVAGRTIPQSFVRRFALAGTQADLARCAQLLRLAPDVEQREHLVAELADAFAGRPLPALPEELAVELARSRGPYAQLMAIRREDAAAIEAALTSLDDADRPVDLRVATICALGDVRAEAAQAIPELVALLGGDEDAAIQNAALSALQMYNDPQIAAQLLTVWPSLPAESQAVAIGVLASRHEWALALAAAIERGDIPAIAVDPDVAGRLRRYGDAIFAQLFPPTSATLSEREARIEALTELMRQGQGSPLAGQELFHGAPACGKCHRMFDRGGDIGPDLTSYNRADLGRMLLALVHPSAEIREGYEVHTVLTVDGRMLSGFKVEDTDQLLVLRGADGQTQTISKEEVDDVFPNEQSLMPEGLVDSLTDDEIRDLFAFLLSTTPPM
jgi:putative heme-binding domain-containing protein